MDAQAVQSLPEWFCLLYVFQGPAGFFNGLFAGTGMPACGHTAGKGCLWQLSGHILKDLPGDRCVVEDSQRFLHRLQGSKEFVDFACLVQGRKKFSGITQFLDLLAQGVALCFIERLPVAGQFPDRFGMAIECAAGEGFECSASVLSGRWWLQVQPLQHVQEHLPDAR